MRVSGGDERWGSSGWNFQRAVRDTPVVVVTCSGASISIPPFRVSSDVEDVAQSCKSYLVATSTHLADVLQLPLYCRPGVQTFERQQ